MPFPLLDVVIATDVMPIHWAFYFQGSGLPLLVSGSWPGSLCRAYIALQDFQAMMLHGMAFHLSAKVVALHLDNSTVKAYLCNQGGTVSPFLSSLACWILSLTDKHGITLYSSIHFYPPQCGGRLSVPGSVASRVASSPSGGSCSFLLLGPYGGGPAGISSYSMPALLYLGNSTTCGALGLNAFSCPWTFQVRYVFFPPALVPLVLSKFLAEHFNSQLRHLILVVPCWMEAPLFPTVLSMLADIPWQCLIVKDLVMDVLASLVLKGL